MLKYKKMNLFDAPNNSILVHACNAKGVWGSGIAKEFKNRYPKAFDLYNNFCNNSEKMFDSSAVGYCPIFWDRTHYIGCLITSSGYANSLDSKTEILVNTTIGLNTFDNWKNQKIYSNKFNSGLFKVPWEETELILKVFVNRYDLDWTVCEI